MVRSVRETAGKVVAWARAEMNLTWDAEHRDWAFQACWALLHVAAAINAAFVALHAISAAYHLRRVKGRRSVP